MELLILALLIYMFYHILKIQKILTNPLFKVSMDDLNKVDMIHSPEKKV